MRERNRTNIEDVAAAQLSLALGLDAHGFPDDAMMQLQACGMKLMANICKGAQCADDGKLSTLLQEADQRPQVSDSIGVYHVLLWYTVYIWMTMCSRQFAGWYASAARRPHGPQYWKGIAEQVFEAKRVFQLASSGLLLLDVTRADSSHALGKHGELAPHGEQVGVCGRVMFLDLTSQFVHHCRRSGLRNSPQRRFSGAAKTRPGCRLDSARCSCSMCQYTILQGSNIGQDLGGNFAEYITGAGARMRPMAQAAERGMAAW
eukprot:jgi/Ulvmu1/8146/UM040_0043.1